MEQVEQVKQVDQVECMKVQTEMVQEQGVRPQEQEYRCPYQ
jgi:hypothetical protein